MRYAVSIWRAGTAGGGRRVATPGGLGAPGGGGAGAAWAGGGKATRPDGVMTRPAAARAWARTCGSWDGATGRGIEGGKEAWRAGAEVDERRVVGGRRRPRAPADDGWGRARFDRAAMFEADARPGGGGERDIRDRARVWEGEGRARGADWRRVAVGKGGGAIQIGVFEVVGNTGVRDELVCARL